MIAINIMRFAGQIRFRIQILIKEQTWIRIKITWIRNPIPALQYKFAKSCLQSQLWIRIYICINVKIWIQIPDLNFTDPEHSFFDCSTSLLRVVYKPTMDPDIYLYKGLILDSEPGSKSYRSKTQFLQIAVQVCKELFTKPGICGKEMFTRLDKQI